MDDALASMLVDDAIASVLVPLPCPCDFGPGQRYRLEELIAAGRDSLVYRAFDKKFSSEGFSAAVCIKIMRSGDGTRKEALSLRRVSHPHVLAVLDQDVDESGYSYIATEYIEGGDLSEQHVPWPMRRAAAFMADVAKGVQAAHSAGVVHCDLKPANIMLTTEGQAKLADFELALWASDADPSNRGNIAFMSPEQFRQDSGALTPQSDVYALGGLLYYLITGHLPNGTSPEEVERTHRERQGSPRLPGGGDLPRICARAMAVDRKDRYWSAGEFADDLARWLDHEPIPWTQPTLARTAGLWARRHRVAATLILVGIIGALSITGVTWHLNNLEKQRAIKLETDTRLRTDARIAEIQQLMRTQLHAIFHSAVSASPDDVEDRVFPILVWMQWLTDAKVIDESARIQSADYRVNTLRLILANADKYGLRDHLNAMLAEYSMAYFLVYLGEYEEPGQVLASLKARWEGRLPPTDSLWRSIQVLEACIEANRAKAAGHNLRDPLRRLDGLIASLATERDQEPVRRVVRQVRNRLGGTDSTNE